MIRKLGFGLLMAAGSLVATSATTLAKPNYPLTPCGADRTQLCLIRGYFNLVPFKYHLALAPECLKRERVRTERGVEVRTVLVCDWPARSMVVW
jgi:hypothetical protein